MEKSSSLQNKCEMLLDIFGNHLDLVSKSRFIRIHPFLSIQSQLEFGVIVRIGIRTKANQILTIISKILRRNLKLLVSSNHIYYNTRVDFDLMNKNSCEKVKNLNHYVILLLSFLSCLVSNHFCFRLQLFFKHFGFVRN